MNAPQDASSAAVVDAKAEKQKRILAAAFEGFSAYGFARTSMADIAQAADMSRPALYQHFANKEAIFTAMLGAILDDAADNALAALETESDLASQLEGFLQRWAGDLTDAIRSTQHGADLLEAKAAFAKTVVDDANRRVTKGLQTHLQSTVGDRSLDLSELLLLSSIGLKYDNPPIKTLRRRLTNLAHTIARSVDGS